MVDTSTVSRCHECGWSNPGTVCPACGTLTHRPPRPAESRVQAASLLAIHEEDFPELADAFRAFRRKDWARYIPLCLVATGVDRPFVDQRGPVTQWVFSQRSAVIVVSHDQDDGTLSIDAPVVDIRPDTEVALLRAALSTTHRMGAARPARRGDLLLLTMVHRLEAMPPPRVIAAIREIALACDALDNLFAFEFGGRLIGPQLRRSGGFDLTLLGQPRKLMVLTGADTRPSVLSATAPVAASPAPAAPTALSRFLDVIREANDLMMAATSFGTIEGPLHVAFALRAAYAGGVELDASRFLLRQAQRLRTGHDQPPSMRVVYPQLLLDRGHTTQWPLAWPRLAATDSKITLAAAIGHADSTRNLAYRRTLLLGALCELILFCDVAPTLVERLRAVHDGSLGTDAATVEQLHATLAKASK